MMKYLQKLGKALMLPVAALPVCGILMGIGYAFAPAVMGAEGATSGFAYTLGFLLIKAGGALIDNMAWLFAIGAAVGLSDDHDGTAGLAGLVSFLMMQQLLSPGVVGAVRTLEEGTVDYPGRGHRYLHRLPEGGRQLLHRHPGRCCGCCLLQQVQEHPAA